MKNIFRKIRYKLIEGNNIKKYLKYAVGEIFLVVIGILFALSINNWNESRKTNDRLKASLQELKIELLADNVRLNEFLIHLKKVDIDGQYLQDFTNDEIEGISTVKLRKAIYNTGMLLTFEKNKTAYENITVSGDIKYLLDIKLKQELAHFYSDQSWGQTYHDAVIMKSFYEYLSYIHKFTKPGVLRSFYKAEMGQKTKKKLQEMFAKKGDLIDWSSLKNDVEFKFLIDKVQVNRFIQFSMYESSKEKSINILKMIDNELKNNR
jgi:hypothetical protein